MAIQFFQVPEHIEASGNPPSRTEHWKFIGSVSESYVQSYALGATPGIVATIYGTLYRQDLRIRQTAYNQWDVQVPYGVRKNETGEWTWDFDTSGATIHIKSSLETTASYPASPTPPDHKNAIGVDGDTVNGTDKVLSALKINVHFKHPLGVLTPAYAKFLASKTGTVNSDSFLTFAPGEVLFLGARGQDGSVAEATATYMFAMSSNATGLTIGDITGVAKKGWESAWIRFKDDVDGGEPVRVPQYVYIERIYDEIAMSTAFGFGA